MRKTVGSFHSSVSLFPAVILGVLAFAGGLLAEAPPALTAIRFNGTDFEGRQEYTLEWDAAPDILYRLQTRPGFESNTTWETFDLAVPTGARGVFKVLFDRMEAGGEGVRRFFQVLAPQPEIFRIEPALIGANGGTVFLFGQCLGADPALRVGGLVISAFPLEPGSVYSFEVPGGALTEGTYDIEVLVGTNVIATASKLFSVTGQPTPVGEAGQRLQEPPSEPPASPMAARGKKLFVGNLPFSATDQRVAFGSKKGYDYYASKKGYEYYMTRVSAANGECVVMEEDLSVPGRGLDFTWTRTHRSRNGTNTVMGQNWDHSYDLRITSVGNAVGGVVSLPASRTDFFLGSNGVYTANEHFEEGTFSNDVFTLTFPDTGKWIFNSLSNSTAPGAIARIEDRNGNALTFNYDASSRLSEIIDTLGRTNRVAYNGQGRVASITDFSGRACTYTYWRNGEAGGGNGDLRSVTTPPVTGMPNTNDFPLGKTTTYTYSLGFADNRLNHNLRTITDPAGKLLLQATYADSFDPADVNFDRVRAATCGDNPPTLFTYLPQSPMPSNSFAVMKTIVNDSAGNVTIDWFDSLNRNIVHRDLAARAVPGTVLTESTLPTAKLRDSDPDFWETRFSWNLDSLCTRVLWPAGNSDKCVYERDLNPACSPRHKADIRVLREVACCDGDGLVDSITSYFQHDPRFGSGPVPVRGNFPIASYGHGTGGSMRSRFGSGPRQTTSVDGTRIIMDRDTGRSKGFGFVISSTDPRGNTDHAEYDALGNCMRVTHEGRLLDASDRTVTRFEYNSHGQPTAIVNPADATGFTRRDEITYYDSGTPNGYMHEWTADTTGPTVRITRYDYDAVGNMTQLVDPRGNTNTWVYNALNQVVKTKAPDLNCTGCVSYERTSFYDVSDNLVRVEQDDRDFNGVPNPAKPTWTTLYNYDALNRCTLVAHELAHTPQQRFATNRFVYDALNNVIEEHSPEAVNGNQPSNFVRYEYDTRNLPLRTTRAPGTADASTSQWSYDGNGRCVRAEHGAGGGGSGGVLLYTYDSLGLVVTATDAMGNIGTSRFNKSGSLVFEQVNGELEDIPGGAGNRRLSETRYEYDSLNRIARRHVSFFDVFTGVPLLDGDSMTTFTYAPDGACRSVTDANGHTTRYSYDTSGRLVTTTDSKTNTMSYAYDPNDNVIAVTQSDSSDVTPGKQTFVMRYEYDALDRCVGDYDNVGNTNRYGYDSRGNLTRHQNAKVQVRGWDYDGKNRATIVEADLDGDGEYEPLVDSIIRQVWDDNSRLIQVVDANSNATRYVYDNLDRHVATTNADNTVERLVWSPRSNVILYTDPNGTRTSFSYDDNDRCVRKDITFPPGSMVSTQTTFELYQYDGMSRCVMASNDLSLLEFSYDSMGNKVRGRQNGALIFADYDYNERRTSITYPSGRIVTSTYDALDQVTSLSTSAGGGLPSVTLMTYAYDGPGRLARMTRGNGINTRWAWNGMQNPPNAAEDFGWQQVSGINHQVSGGGATIDRRVSVYDRNQNKILRQQVLPFPTGVPALTTNIMGYDALDRMTSFARNRASSAYTATFALDANGNRQSVSSNGVVDIYTMDATLPQPADFQMDQYSSTPFGTFEYDRNGNRVFIPGPAGGTQFTYDYANRLVEVARSAGPAFVPIVSFTYDAIGRRISKTKYPDAPALPVTTQYLLDPDSGDDGILEEHINGTPQFFAVWPHMHKSGTHVRISAGGETYYSHVDEMGNVLAITDSNTNVVERYDYDAFGSPRFLTADGVPLVGSDGQPATESQVGNRYLFQGMIWDGETGFYLARHRPTAADPYPDPPNYMDPKSGRLLSRSSKYFGSPQTEARSTFAGNNPWSERGVGGSFKIDAKKQKQWLPANFRLGGGGGGGAGGIAIDESGVHVAQAMFNPREYSVSRLRGTTKTQGDFNLARRFKEVSGLASESEVIAYRDGEDRTIHTRPGNHKAGKITVTKDWSNTSEWYKWRKAVLDGKVERKSISIIFQADDNSEAGRYNFFEAWPCRWKGPAMNAKNSGHATEVLEISWETMELKHK